MIKDIIIAVFKYGAGCASCKHCAVHPLMRVQGACLHAAAGSLRTSAAHMCPMCALSINVNQGYSLGFRPVHPQHSTVLQLLTSGAASVKYAGPTSSPHVGLTAVRAYPTRIVNKRSFRHTPHILLQLVSIHGGRACSALSALSEDPFGRCISASQSSSSSSCTCHQSECQLQ